VQASSKFTKNLDIKYSFQKIKHLSISTLI